MNFEADVVVTRFNESDSLVNDCITALTKQKNSILNLIYLEQKEESKVSKKFLKSLNSKSIKVTYKKIPPISLSFARDLGIKMATSNYVLFTDIDAIPNNNWAEQMIKSLRKGGKVGVVGGKSIPIWPKKTKWYHRSKIVLELYSMVDISDSETEVEKVVGVNFGINKKILGKQATFNMNLGRRKGDFSGGEETDLCKRAKENGLIIWYNPDSIVGHQVSEERMSFWWIQKRMYYGGLSRSKRGGRPKTFTKKRTWEDRIVLPLLAPAYILGYLRGKKK